VFLPSTSTVLLALEVSPWLALDLAARRAPAQPPAPQPTEATWTEEDLQRGRAVLGEQFIGLLAMLARRKACHEPGSELHVVDLQKQFDIEFEQSFTHHLVFASSHPRYLEVLHCLASDFLDWVRTHPSELPALGLISRGHEGIFLICKPLAPVLTPLPD
jgi:hypothetical protein